MATATSEIPVPGATRRTGGVMGKLAFVWWFLRRYPVIPVIILIILVIDMLVFVPHWLLARSTRAASMVS